MLKVEQLDYRIKFSPKQVLNQIYTTVEAQEKVFTQTYVEIVERLKEKNILIIDEQQLIPTQSKFVTDYFLNNIRRFLFPIMMENLKTTDDIEDRALYLAVYMTSSVNPKKRRFCRDKAPPHRSGITISYSS